MSEDKNYIIDPLTTLCKLALMHYMPEGTKLGISHHVLHIQESGYLQWMERMKNGDTRIDTSNLDIPLIKAIKWYILDDKEKVELEEETESSLDIIASFSIKGLRKLQNHTYKNDKNIRIVLQYFINLLNSALFGSWKEENVIKIESENNLLSDKIKHNFENGMIHTIAQMLKDAENPKNSQKDIEAIVDCIHNLLKNRDDAFVKLMREANTTL